MPRKRKKPALWRFSAGKRGATVTVCERTPGGRLYAMVWHPVEKHQVYRSLRHRDKELAKQYARNEAEKLRVGLASVRAGVLTLGVLLDLYLADIYPSRSEPKKRAPGARRDDERHAEFWRRVLGEATAVTSITVRDWDRIRAKRLAGEIDARGRTVPVAKRKQQQERTGPEAVKKDGVFLRAVFYWAMRHRGAENVPLMTYNPFGAPAPGVKSAFELPSTSKPRRPVTSDTRFERVRAVASKVLMQAPRAGRRGRGWKPPVGAVQVETKPRRNNASGKLTPMKRWMVPSYLPELLDLHWETGRRRGAVLDLRYDDIVRERGEIVELRWRPTKHVPEEQVVPVSDRARRALERVLAMRPGIGHRPLFPSPFDASRPISESAVNDWLLEAEKLAGVDKQDGGLWHPYRRGWATKRKHLPDVDAAAAGGWTDIATMKRSYQHADDETLRIVVNEPARLEERKRG